jgi:hypothetical protein
MQEAVSIKLRRDVKAGHPDPWVDLPEDLRQQAVQLEGFRLYTEEVEQLLDRAGFPSAPSAPSKLRQAAAPAAKT